MRTAVSRARRSSYIVERSESVRDCLVLHKLSINKQMFLSFFGPSGHLPGLRFVLCLMYSTSHLQMIQIGSHLVSVGVPVVLPHCEAVELAGDLELCGVVEVKWLY